MIIPRWSDEAPRCFAYNGSIGMMRPKPIITTKSPAKSMAILRFLNNMGTYLDAGRPGPVRRRKWLPALEVCADGRGKGQGVKTGNPGAGDWPEAVSRLCLGWLLA